MSARRLFSLLLLLSLCQPLYAGETAVIRGTVLDAQSGKPIAAAIVTLQQHSVLSDNDGAFTLMATAARTIGARATGYGRSNIRLPDDRSQPLTLRLIPFKPKALYLSFYGIGSRILRGAALDLLQQTELNALVIDVKGDRGMLPYRSQIALAAEIGAQRIITVRDMPQLMAELHNQGIYLIARIVVFKDDLLADAHPQWAVKTAAGQPWQDREQLSWVDPFQHEVWAYNLDIAEEAAALGFDEIQFDYLRFPDTLGLTFSQPNTEANRVQAINGFLAAARQRLTPYNVFLAADIFGYVSWNSNDTFIGQQLEDMVLLTDYLSPMLYPSGFQFGIPGYRDPVAHPQEIVALSLHRARERSGVTSTRFRPWLQAFRDYAFDRRTFGATEIRQQINAAEQFGSDGWMLWNPRNSYSAMGLKDKRGKLIVAPEADAAAPADTGK
ncbi:MAG: carboxypeptidase regulatory-like domain-containing protein [Burkholderiales bacterium]|nr:carboxypeptidase regulatory-like domain-containing protein [Burkholderiales bacterium]